MDLIVASSNSNKVKRLKILISAVNPEIKIRPLGKRVVKAPLENSKHQKENLITKLSYYYRFLKKDIVCEDDAFEFENKDGHVLIVNVNSFFKGTGNVFQLWQEYFQKNNIERGKLIKYFGVNVDGKLKTSKVVIPVIVKTDVTVKKFEKNILNNFIGPLSFGKSFAQISKSEKDNYMNSVCLPALKKIL